MKKLLAAGEPRLFQFAPVFRNGERAALHHPAFLLLEWYRAGSDYRDIIDRKSVMLGKSVSVRVALGGRRIIKQNKKTGLVTYRTATARESHNKSIKKKVE